jgi:UDP-N-acetylmuramate--alanine ligase
VTVIDDYGHHPTEIAATLDTLRSYGGSRRTVVLYQPHRFTRTQALWEDFCRVFHQADVLLLTDIYSAGEAAIPGITSADLARAIGERGHRRVVYAGPLAQATDLLVKEAGPGDLVLTLGAGSVWQAGEALLRQRRGGGHG